ncbi:hypothetical protein [Streptococcus sanguinis]|uniref:Uncharacterized protein n=1 Tax=Streptococcus sanguinis TaxID=1305 RepID=A0A7H8UYC7_STRSA|nr:hypothetical protein [Streptococcus sanguinis]QLB49396.1 hypothetical protein FDP16_01815 [Streptococcus sanguinis]
MRINCNEFKKNTIDFSKKVGCQIVDGVKKCWEWNKENPEIIIGTGIIIVAGVLANYSEDFDYEIPSFTISDNSKNNRLESDSSSILSFMPVETVSKSSHYPENRKSADTHIYRYNGKNFVRGGTEEEKQQFKENHKALFE